jgi:glycosyltransferase involved in cell wall biosynthesis
VREALTHVLKVDFWDVDEMANKVIGLLAHQPLWEELSEAGLAEVRSPRLGLDHAARLTADSYTGALQALTTVP